MNPELKNHFEKKGLQFVGQDVEGQRMEIIELKGERSLKSTELITCGFKGNGVFFMFVPDHCYFVGVQYHPEFTSRPIKPSPPYFGLLLAAAGKLQSYLSRGCHLSQR